MSIPDFNSRGVLPKGFFQCTIEEFLDRYCYPTQVGENRRTEYKIVLEQLFGHSIERGARSIIFGGSFITKQENPEDIDCIIPVPNDRCIPSRNENIVISNCKLDILYINENNQKLVYSLMNMFSKDRFELDVGLVEVSLEDGYKSFWSDFMEEYDFTDLLLQREAYIHRHFIIGNKRRGLLVTIHGINSHALWNLEIAPTISSNDWIFAPFYYGYEQVALFTEKRKSEILDKFRDWIDYIYKCYNIEPSIFSHSFGTYIIGKYIAGFNYTPPVKLCNIILAGSILNPGFDWISALEKNHIKTVFNIISPNDPYVPYMDTLKWLRKDKLYGTAGVKGFNQTHPRLIQESFEVFDHSSMIKNDVFTHKVMPYLNLMNKFNIFNNFEYVPSDVFAKLMGKSEA